MFSDKSFQVPAIFDSETRLLQARIAKLKKFLLNGTSKNTPDASLIVQDFLIFENGSSCNSLLVGHILSYFSSIYIALHPILSGGCN